MTLLTELGRYDRSAVVQRAKRLMPVTGDWGEAMRAAYAEAMIERKQSINSKTDRRCHQLAREADRLLELENAR